MAPSTAALQIRESFGDRKVPDISRKITACVACRKLKVRYSGASEVGSLIGIARSNVI